MDEDVLVPLIVFSFVLILIGMILNHSRWKYLQKQKNKGTAEEGGGSLRTSELRALIQEAVLEATMPLQQRIDTLEDLLRQERAPRLMPAREEEWTDEDLEPSENAGRVQASAHRTPTT